MAQAELDALLTRMSAIAEAVNAFNSEAVQHEAFSALIAAFEDNHHNAKRQHPRAAGPGHLTDAPPAEIPAPAKPANGPPRTKRSSKDPRSEWKMVRDLDLNPAGKQSFNEFISEKNPRTNEEKYAAAVFYLAETLEMPKVTIHHVGSTFRLTKSWKEPIDLGGGLRVTASRKGTIDTTSYDDIKITPAGRNLIEHELPRIKAKK